MGIYEINEGLRIEKITDERRMSVEVDEVEYGYLAPEGWNDGEGMAYSLIRDGKEAGMLIKQGQIDDGSWWVTLSTGPRGEVTRRGGSQYVFVRISEKEAEKFLKKAKQKGIYAEKCDWCGAIQSENGRDVCEECGEEL